MVKRVLLTSLISILATGLCGGYFFHVGREVKHIRLHTPCTAIEVVVKDSLTNSLISSNEVLERITPYVSMSCTDSINLEEIESTVAAMGEVACAQAFRIGNEKITIELCQRVPVVRFMDATGSRYADSEGYLFPVRSFTDVPVFTGNIPFKVERNFKGYLDGKEKEWLQDVISLAQVISKDSYWNRQIGQVDVAGNGDFILYTNAGDQTVIFGDASQAEFKLRKLSAFYRNILPTEKGSEYRTVNLKYGDQIICK